MQKIQNIEIGEIYESNNYGKFKILDYLGRDDNRHKKFSIQFINTENIDTAFDFNIRNGCVRDPQYEYDYKPGTIYSSNNYGDYEIIKKLGKEYGDRKFLVKFKDTGYETVVCSSQIREGNIYDPYAKVILGIACKGIVNNKSKEAKRQYCRWHNMIFRCYDRNDKHYALYGGAGVTVCERWLTFEYFFEDMPKIPGYDMYIKYPTKYQLDKDMKQQGIPKNQMVYSPETCVFISSRTNNNLKTPSSTGYHGVHASGNKFRAQILHNKKSTIIGIYNTAELAAGAYNCFVLLFHPDSPLNPVRTLTYDELVLYDTRKKQIMCNTIDTKNSCISKANVYNQSAQLQIAAKDYISLHEISTNFNKFIQPQIATSISPRDIFKPFINQSQQPLKEMCYIVQNNYSG